MKEQEVAIVAQPSPTISPVTTTIASTVVTTTTTANTSENQPTTTNNVEEKAKQQQQQQQQIEEPLVPERLRLLSFNFLMRPPPISYNGNDYKDERLAEFVEEHLKEYDVIAFQEVFGLLNNRRERLIEIASKQTGHCWSHFSPSPPRFPVPKFLVDGGLLILSRHPIIEKDSVSFGRGMNADLLAMKGALYTKLELHRRSGNPCAPSHLHLFTTHLQADYEKNEHKRTVNGNKPNQAMRRAQLRILMQFIRSKTAKDNDPIVCLGDFNINSRKTAVDGTDSEEYIEAIETIRACGFIAKDLLKECSSNSNGLTIHPITICDSYEGPDGNLISTEPQLTPHNEFHLRRSIDYVFSLEKAIQSDIPIQCPSYVVTISSSSSSQSATNGSDVNNNSLVSNSSETESTSSSASSAKLLKKEMTEDDQLLATVDSSSVTCGCFGCFPKRKGSSLLLPRFMSRFEPWRWCGVWGDTSHKSKEDENISSSHHTNPNSTKIPPNAIVMQLPPGPQPQPAPGHAHTQVEKFVSSRGLGYNQLSDHYGVSSLWHF